MARGKSRRALGFPPQRERGFAGGLRGAATIGVLGHMQPPRRRLDKPDVQDYVSNTLDEKISISLISILNLNLLEKSKVLKTKKVRPQNHQMLCEGRKK